MANDITTTEQPAAQLVTGATEEVFTENTGYTRQGASRTVNAVLTVIGATMQDGLSPAAQFGGAVNVLGMAVAEILAGSGANAQQRADLIASVSEFVTKTSDDLSQRYAESRRLAEFTVKTTNEDLKPSAAAGPAN